MKFSLPLLPYAENALEPHISARTMQFHYHKHHKGYFDKVKALIADTPFAEMTLDQIIRKTAGDAKHKQIFNNAAQVWNHTKFWESMTPGGGSGPNGAIEELVRREFGNYDGFRKKFSEAAMGRFGSGWTWLVLDNGTLRITTTPNAETPLTAPVTPLIAFDVWEHAYYLDYQNERAKFIEAFLDGLLNWQHANACIAKAPTQVAGPPRRAAG